MLVALAGLAIFSEDQSKDKLLRVELHRHARSFRRVWCCNMLLMDPIFLGWIGAVCVLWVIDYLRRRK